MLSVRTSVVRLPLPVAVNPLTLPSGLAAVHPKVDPVGEEASTIEGELPEQMVWDVVVLETAGTVLTSAVNAVLVALEQPAGLPISTASA